MQLSNMITLADIKKPLSFKISVGLSMGTIEDYAKCVAGTDNYYKIDFDVFLPSINKNLQRPLVWTLEQKQALILSIFKETYIPPVCVIQHKDNSDNRKLEIIDGKQRLSTMIAFYNNEFPIIVKDNAYYFKELSPELQSRYKFTDVIMSVAYSYDYEPSAKISDESKIAWFEMINFAGTPQDIEHLNNLKTK